MYEWPQLYNTNSNFVATYQTLNTGKTFLDFHLQDGVLFHFIHVCVPSSERENMIWESHYSQAT
jgi:hypothetical protein